ncbi:MAG: ABC transporter permease [Actinomycetota bacterium]
MTTPTIPTPSAPPASPPMVTKRTWALSRRGVSSVIQLELRQRVRSSRWKLMLGLFFLTIGGLSGLVMGSSGFDEDSGTYLYGAIVALVLSLGLLVSPALTSTSVNGDRGNGTLAPLQMTLLSPAEIAVGKMLAGWFTALVFLATSLPFLLLALIPGGTSITRFFVTLVMVMLILLVICAIALGWSAITARSVSSVVLTYLTVAFLGLGTLLLFGVSYPLVTVQQEVRVLENPSTPENFEGGFDQIIPQSECVETKAIRSVTHTEATWWLLAANPYVIVADAAPGGSGSDDVFTYIKAGVRQVQRGPEEPLDECWASQPSSFNNDSGAPEPGKGLVWPFGLAFHFFLGALGLWAAVRRLTLPVRRLPRGTRIA